MAQSLNDNTFQGFRIFNTLHAVDGPKSLTIPLNFSLFPSYTIDLQVPIQRGIIPWVSTIFIDNSLNTAAGNILSVAIAQSQQTIQAALQTQGYYPVCAPNPFMCTVSLGGVAANVTTMLIFMNIPMPGFVWVP